MSFFGFDSSLPRDRAHDSNAPGFSAPRDAFAGFSGRDTNDNEEILDFEDTYDGLGDQLDESADAFNTDTFGAGISTGKDFDYSGQGAASKSQTQPSALPAFFSQQSTQQAPSRHVSQPQPQQQPARQPTRTGYEKYQQSSYIPDLEIEASIWGKEPPKQTSSTFKDGEPGRRMLTLEEVEAMNRASASARRIMSVEEVEAAMRGSQQATPAAFEQHRQQPQKEVQPPQQPQQPGFQQPPQQSDFQSLPGFLAGTQPPTGPRNDQIPSFHQAQQQFQTQGPEGFGQGSGRQGFRQQRQHDHRPNRSRDFGNNQRPMGDSYSAPPNPRQQEALEARNAYLLSRNMRNQRNVRQPQEEPKTEKEERRFAKIQEMSGRNETMKPQDKSFIHRNQLTQLMGNLQTAESGGGNFYYEVFKSFQQGNGSNALAYGRPTNAHRIKYFGEGQKRMMAQQVQRAAEAAKNYQPKPKINTEGSLGRISASNVTAPRKLIKFGQESGKTIRIIDSATKMGIYAMIEDVYNALMRFEELLKDNADIAILNAQADKVWSTLKVDEEIDIDAENCHPAVSMLNVSKGKKFIGRVYKTADPMKRLTLLAILGYTLSRLDVIGAAYQQHVAWLEREVQLSEEQRRIRDQRQEDLVQQAREKGMAPPKNTTLTAESQREVDCFQDYVLPAFHDTINSSTLAQCLDFLRLLIQPHQMWQAILQSKIGIQILSHAIVRTGSEFHSQQGSRSESDAAAWREILDDIFAKLTNLGVDAFFVNAGADIHNEDDRYVWAFFQALSATLRPEQSAQLKKMLQRRVNMVQNQASGLPEDEAGYLLSKVQMM